MRFDSPSWVTRIGAFAGLAFMHIPVLVIILYAFTTEDRTYQFPPPGLTLPAPARILPAVPCCTYTIMPMK